MKLNDILIEEILKEGVYDRAIFKTIFMAGGPGSGKSYVLNKSTMGHGFKVVASDVPFERLIKKHGLSLKFPKDQLDKIMALRPKAKKTANAQHDAYIDGRLGFIVDGTGKNYSKIKSHVADLKKLGYDCYMVFVNTSLEVALERNQKRERSLPEDIVKQAWYDAQQNLGKFQSLFGRSNISIIDNSTRDNSSGLDKLWKEVKKFAESSITNPIAKKWITLQLKLRNRLK